MITGKVVILRLSTGEDIIGTVSEQPDGYQIISPFKVIFRRLKPNMVGLTIVPWMMDELLDEHTIYMAKSQVICTMVPKEEFIQYYHRVSDDMYMRLIEYDQIYRDQLSTLEKMPTASSLDQFLPKSRYPFGMEESDSEPDYDPFDTQDDEPPSSGWN